MEFWSQYLSSEMLMVSTKDCGYKTYNAFWKESVSKFTSGHSSI